MAISRRVILLSTRESSRRLMLLYGIALLCLSTTLAQEQQAVLTPVSEANVTINPVDNGPSRCLGPNESLAKKY